MDIKSNIKQKLQVLKESDHGFSDEFVKAKKKQDELDVLRKEAGKPLDKYPKGKMGLTPEHIRLSPEYRAEKAKYDIAFKNYQDYSAQYSKTFSKEIKALYKKYGYGPKPF